MKIIRGVKIDEEEELSYNIDKIRHEISQKRSFWFNYKNAILSYEKKKNGQKASIVFKSFLFIFLIPQFINSIFNENKTNKLILDTENELIDYYNKPKTKVKRFRLKCERAKALYQDEIDEIDAEIEKQTDNLELDSIGDQTRLEIKALIKEFQDRKNKKLNKYDFYHKCGERLKDIEEQIDVKKSIESSKRKLQELEEIQVDPQTQKEVEEEFELYTYYGDLLDSISTNLKKLELDKEERIEEKEVHKMMRDLKNFD